MPSPMQPVIVMRVTIKKGLEGQDDNLDLLASYFQELQTITVEPHDIDLLTFAACTHYFGVIALEPGTQQDKGDPVTEGDLDAEGEPEEDSVDAGYVASPPPPSVTSISSAASFESARSAVRFGREDSASNPGRPDMYPATPEDEKVLKWREAFLAQLQESDDEEQPLLSKGKERESYHIQSVPEKRPIDNAPASNMSNDPNDYINWPDDIPSEEDADDLRAQDRMLYHETEAYSRLDQVEFTTNVLGREILEPEQFNSPVREIPEIIDHNMEELVYQEAIKFRDALRAERIQAYYQKASASRPLFIEPPKSKSTPIGIIYLASSQNVDDSMHRGQLNIGIYVAPDYIKQRGLVDAIKEVVNEAFRDINCHRVQATVVDHKTKLHTLELYTSTGFSREGIGRRVFFSPITHEWKDVLYFAMLDTDWVFYNNKGVPSSVCLRPKSLWDDLLICQERERAELLRMEEKTLKRSNSIETIRDKAPTASRTASTSRSETFSVTNASTMSDAISSSAARDKTKRRRLGVGSGNTNELSTRRSRTPSSSSSMVTIDTMSTISSEWEIPARQAFAIPPSNGASAPITPDASTSSTGCWVMLENKI